MPPKPTSTSATTSSHPAPIPQKGPPPSLLSLEATMAGDRLLREQVLSLVEKEKRLAELELLLRIAASSGEGVVIGGHARRSQKLIGKENVPSSSSSTTTSELAKRSTYSATLFDDSDPTRIDASCLAPAPWWPIPASGCLRPRSERPEISGSEAALLGSSAALKNVRIGIDLSRMQPPLQDESGAVGYLQTLFSVAAGAGASQTLRVLNVSVNQLGLAGATALVEAIGTKLPKLEALCAEHNPLGGPPGIGAIIDVCSKAPSLCHIGVTISCVDPLVGAQTAPYMLVNIQVTPPGLQAEKAKSSKDAKKGAEKKPAVGDKKTAAKGAAKSGAAASGPVQGSLHHLSNAIRGGGGSISSISLAGSSLTREGLLSFLAAWAPPEPVPVVESVHSHDSAGAAAKGKVAAAAPPPPAAAKKGTTDKAGAKGGSVATSQKQGGKFVPIQALSLSRTHCGALSALDLSVALGPAPVRGGALDDKLMSYVKKLGGLTPNAEQTSAAAVTAAVAAQAPGAAAATATSSKSKSSLQNVVLGSSVHGCLQFIRILNLSSCGLSTHGVIPILETIALHSNYLTHLILRDNYIDDVGALALSTALRLNQSRITTLQKDAMAFSTLNDPYFKLTGDYPGKSSKSPPPSLSDNSQVEHHLSVANAAKLNGRHFSPVRIVDITNNPLSLSAEAGSHPGCAALVDCLESIESLLTLCGPAPSVESQHLYNVAAKLPPQWPGTLTSAQDIEAVHIVDSLPLNTPLPDEILAGEGEAYPLDLSSIAYSAHATLVGGGGSSAASSGTVSSASRGLLGMPSRLSHGAAQVTISKITRLNAAINEARKTRRSDAPSSSASSIAIASSTSSSSTTSPPLVLSRLRLPVSTTVWLQPLSLSPLSFSLNNTRCLSALSLQEADCGSNGCATLLGPPVATLGLSSGISAHSIADVPVSITSSSGAKAAWALKTPSAMIEWRAGLVSSIESARNAGLYSLVFHVFVCGANNTSMQYIHSTTLGEGSRDRSHARMRMVARTKAIDSDNHTLDGIDKVTTMAADDASIDWAEGAGLELPRALGTHNAQSDVNALPATVTVQAAESSGSDLVAWPVSWHCAEIPSYMLSSVGEKTIKIFAELVQTSVRGLKNDSIADSSKPLSLHILEAEVVMTSSAEAGSYQGLADIEYHF